MTDASRRLGYRAPMADHETTGPRPEPPMVPAALRRDGSEEIEHAQPGSDWPTLCGIPADEVDLYRHTFRANPPWDCPTCSERIWRLDHSRRLSDFVSLIWVADAPAVRLILRASSLNEAGELLRMRFGDSAVISFWEVADRSAGMDFVSEPELTATADQVVVFTGTGFDTKNRKKNQRLAVERSSPAIIELAGLLNDYRPGEPMDLMEWPALSIAFLKDRGLLAEYGLLAGTEWVRTPTTQDWQIRNAQRVRSWLHNRGIEPA